MRLTELKGIGEKTEQLMEKAGIHDVMDLLFLFPRDYEIFSAPCCVGEIGCRSFAAVRGVFIQDVNERRAKKLLISQSIFKDETGATIRAVWFNAPFIKNTVKAGVPCVLRGRISRKYMIPQIDQPRVYSLAEYDRLEGTMSPVYPLSKGLTNALLTRAVKQALQTEEL